MGTPEFAIPSIKMLNQSKHDVALVVTQTDKLAGRGKVMTMPLIKKYAIENGLTVMQPENWKCEQYIQALADVEPDLIITVAYGKILPKKVLDIPKIGCINVHASLLPKYRGAAPINWAIIKGESITGVTTMWMDAGMDTGDMILKKSVCINKNMTAGELHNQLSVVGAEALKDTLENLDNIKRIPQNNNEATYAPMIDKSIGHIQWEESASAIHNLVRGLNPYPGAYAFFKDMRVKMWETIPVIESNKVILPGQVVYTQDGGILVGCGKGHIQILELQVDSGKRMLAEQFSRGHNIACV